MDAEREDHYSKNLLECKTLTKNKKIYPNFISISTAANIHHHPFNFHVFSNSILNNPI